MSAVPFPFDADAESARLLGRFRFTARYRGWVGKPDPSNMGIFRWYSDELVRVTDEANRVAAKGHKVQSIEKWEDGKWRRI